MGEFEEEALAIGAGAAEGGQELEEADQVLGFLLKGGAEGGSVAAGDDLADAQGGDELSSGEEFSVVVLAEDIEQELDLGLGFFAALLFREPDGIAGLFPTVEIGAVKADAGGSERSNGLGIRDTLAQHAVDGLADVRGQFTDFVAREAGDSGEVTWREVLGAGGCLGCG